MTLRRTTLLQDLWGIPRFEDLIDRPLQWPTVTDSSRTIQCPFCERRFATHNDKRQHVKAKHWERTQPAATALGHSAETYLEKIGESDEPAN